MKLKNLIRCMVQCLSQPNSGLHLLRFVDLCIFNFSNFIQVSLAGLDVTTLSACVKN